MNNWKKPYWTFSDIFSTIGERKPRCEQKPYNSTVFWIILKKWRKSGILYKLTKKIIHNIKTNLDFILWFDEIVQVLLHFPHFLEYYAWSAKESIISLKHFCSFYAESHFGFFLLSIALAVSCILYSYC